MPDRNNLQILTAIAGNGADQAVEVPRDQSLLFRASGEVEIREAPNHADFFPWPADTPTPPLGGRGQTLYLRAAVGVTIRLALV